MNYRFTLRHCGALLALATSALLNAAAAEPETPFQAAFAQFSQAQAGDSAAAERAAASFGALLRTEPLNPVVMAYAGASTAKLARTTMLPWKKMSYAEDGLAMLDKALAMLTPAHDAVAQNAAPAALEVRFVAASTFLAVPGFMNRGARGAKLLAELVASPLLVHSPLGFRGSVWLRAAQFAQDEGRADEARQYLDKVISHNAPQADAARAQLKALAS